MDKPLKPTNYQGSKRWFYNQDLAPFLSPQMLASSLQQQSPPGHQHSQKCETLNKGKFSVQTRSVPGQPPKQTLRLQHRLTT